MAATADAYLRAQLEERRKRLLAASIGADGDGSMAELLLEVNSALERMDGGTYGICEECHDTIENDRLLNDPLTRVCLDHLSEPERRALENDLELAARVQRGLLPANNLRASGWQIHYRYEPAGTVSGDYCDVIRGEGNSGDVFFSVGDVSGKGVAASMLMTHLHAMFRSLGGVGLPIDRLLARANSVFCESTTAGQYATLACGRASASGDVELSSAGHLPALLLRRKEVRSLAATGLPLGMFSSGKYPLEKLKLESGDSLILYTDGLTEVVDGTGREYGIGRLAAFFEGRHSTRPETLTADCLKEISKFSATGSAKDDRTMLVLYRE
ncbi:MAG TPA: SpoIIE family protein phosphatase [Candidatus Acidoferrales bacterium]|nr:SpoIIE family protein phosphatase [Candidatus Acidoferrales bacterium]